MSATSAGSAALGRALTQSAARCGVALDIRQHRSTAWASATFAGARHQLSLACRPDTAVDRWLAALDEEDLPVAHQLVADIGWRRTARDADRVTIDVEILTVETA